MFEFAEYKITIEAGSIEEAKKILQAEITAGNLVRVSDVSLEVKAGPTEPERTTKEIKK